MSSFSALVLEEADGKITAQVRDLADSDLPPGEVTVAVSHSTLNYKDGMVLNNIGGLVRNWPHVPGIDFAGTVVDSSDDRYAMGDAVLLNGWRVGEAHWGGYAQKARVQADWLLPLPGGLGAADAMAIGTAGYCAMLAVMALEDAGLKPGGRPVLVTGANGGVGTVAVALLGALGHEVVASTGRMELAAALKALGASEVINRAEFADVPGRPLLKERWAAAVDAVGGVTLAHILAGLEYGGAVAACGLAGGSALDTTVIPFLLRGVSLLGIDSVMCPFDRRRESWRRLATDLPIDKLRARTRTVGLGDLPGLAGDILGGAVEGRVIVDVNR